MRASQESVFDSFHPRSVLSRAGFGVFPMKTRLPASIIALPCAIVARPSAQIFTVVSGSRVNRSSHLSVIFGRGSIAAA